MMYKIAARPPRQSKLNHRDTKTTLSSRYRSLHPFFQAKEMIAMPQVCAVDARGDGSMKLMWGSMFVVVLSVL
jgi:hypothetical protein